MRFRKAASRLMGGIAWRTRRATVVPLVLCGLGGVTPARAQSSPPQATETLRRAIVTPEAVFVPLPAEIVCGPKVESIVLSPRRNYALIVRRSVAPARDLASYLSQSTYTNRDTQEGDAGAPELQLLLWGPGSRRPATVWRWTPNPTYAYASLDKVLWLAGTDTALAQITLVPRPAKPEPGATLLSSSAAKQTQIVRIHAATGKTETLATVKGELFLGGGYATSTALGSADNGKTVFTIGEQGQMKRLADFPLDGERRRRAIWKVPLADGRLSGLLHDTNDDGKLRWRTVAWNLKTGAVDDWNTQTSPEPTPPPLPPLPFRLTRTADALKSADTTRLTTLWLQAPDAPATEHILLTADMDERTEPVTLETGLLYQQQGNLFAVPLVRTRPAAFAALCREQFKQETLRRARSIGLYAYAVALSNDKRLPQPEGFIPLLQAYANADPDQAHLLENPATGKPALTVAYTNANLPTLPDPTTQILAYLTGPTGRAVIYYGGHAAWEDIP